MLNLNVMNYFEKYKSFVLIRKGLMEQCNRLFNLTNEVQPDLIERPLNCFSLRDNPEFENGVISFNCKESENSYLVNYYFSVSDFDKTDEQLKSILQENKIHKVSFIVCHILNEG